MMMLAAAIRLHEDEVRADLQRVYGIDLDHARAGKHTARHIAALVSCLPSDSMIAKADNPDAVWTLETCVLADIDNLLTGLIWGMSDPKRRGRQRNPIGPSWMTKGNERTLDARVLSIDELMAELEKPRKEGAHGG